MVWTSPQNTLSFLSPSIPRRGLITGALFLWAPKRTGKPNTKLTKPFSKTNSPPQLENYQSTFRICLSGSRLGGSSQSPGLHSGRRPGRGGPAEPEADGEQYLPPDAGLHSRTHYLCGGRVQPAGEAQGAQAAGGDDERDDPHTGWAPKNSCYFDVQAGSGWIPWPLKNSCCLAVRRRLISGCCI